MKFAVIGDRHIEARHPRYDEALGAWDWVIDSAIDQGVDGFLCLGDVCEVGVGTDEIYEIGARYRRMLDQGWVIEIQGNHEPNGGLRWAECLRPWQSLDDIDADRLVGAHFVWAGMWSVQLAEWARVLCVPYYRRGYTGFQREIMRPLVEEYQAAAECMGRAIAAYSYGAPPLIVAGHWTVQGLRVNPSEYELTGSKEMIVPLSALAPARLVLTGHVHEAQDFRYGNTDIVGVGSTYRVTFAERDQEKSYVVVELDGTQITWRRQPIPVRPMREMRISGRECREIVASLIDGAKIMPQDVKLVIDVPADDLTRYDDLLAPLATLPGHYPWEIRRAESARTRAPEITAASTLRHEFEIWLASTGRVLEPAQRERVLTCVEELT